MRGRALCFGIGGALFEHIKMALPMSEADIFGDDTIDELAGMAPDDIQRRSRLLENEIRVLKVFNASSSDLVTRR